MLLEMIHRAEAELDSYAFGVGWGFFKRHQNGNGSSSLLVRVADICLKAEAWKRTLEDP